LPFFGLRPKKREPKEKNESLGSIYDLLTAIKTCDLGSVPSPARRKGILQEFKCLGARHPWQLRQL